MVKYSSYQQQQYKKKKEEENYIRGYTAKFDERSQTSLDEHYFKMLVLLSSISLLTILVISTKTDNTRGRGGGDGLGYHTALYNFQIDYIYYIPYDM